METLDTLDETSGVQAVVAAVRNRANEIRGNLGPKNLWEERVERADELMEIADRTEKAYRLENHCPKRFDKDGDEMPPHFAFDDLKIDRLGAEVAHWRFAAKKGGDMAKMREVLDDILAYWGRVEVTYPPERRLRDAAIAALSAPPRNCDVGTAMEQLQRFHSFCRVEAKGESCHGCQFFDENAGDVHCGFLWAQLPYETPAAQGGGDHAN